MILPNRRTGAVILLFIFLIFSVTPVVSGSSFDVSGYYKSFFTLLSTKSLISEEGDVDVPDMGIVINNLRLKFSVNLSSFMTVNLAYDIYPSVTYNSSEEIGLPIVFLEPSVYRFKDLKQKLYPSGNSEESNFALNNNLDRLFITIKSDFADIFIGRQSISWGSARVFNPTDILAPFNFNQIDKEERAGIDAIRVRVPVGMMNELDAGYVFGDRFRFSESAFFLRGKFNILKSDISLLTMGFRGNLLIGMDVSSSIGGAGIWFEGAYVKAGVFSPESGHNDDDDYLRVSVGSDYNFAKNTYVFFEYHYNSAGISTPSNYIELFNTVPYREGNVYQMGRHYLSLGVNRQLHPLMGLNTLLIYNITDGSFIFSPLLDYNISENIYISLGGFWGFGKRARMDFSENSNSPVTELRSEFGTYPDIIYSSFRIYF